MGGVSGSRFKVTETGNAVFSAEVSLENYGGFASLINEADSYDLSNYDGIELKVRGDGKKYKFYVKNNTKRDSTLYQSVFLSEKDKWLTIKIPFCEFIPTFRGGVLKDAPQVDVKNISAIGFLISDKQE